MTRMWTVGHSTRDFEELVGILQAAGITLLVEFQGYRIINVRLGGKYFGFKTSGYFKFLQRLFRRKRPRITLCHAGGTYC